MNRRAPIAPEWHSSAGRPLADRARDGVDNDRWPTPDRLAPRSARTPISSRPGRLGTSI
ncbi:hypothetical protein [Micromonospora chokoriensis]|uniref:hypothetical protein n=1 Tax=Micromonospora chokoriensis TaxID=356851 RepID=UPI000AFE8A19|nr:hypothetical protein [Micromonospora chokoriensis]